jgi:hypothetical protein
VAEGTDIGDSKVPTGTMVEGQFKDYGSVSANTMQPAVTKTKSDAGKSTAYNSGFKVGRAGGPSKVPDGLHPDHHASWKRGHESGDYYLRTMAAHDEKMAGGNKIQKQGVAEGRAGVDDTDTVGFSVNTEAAYTAVMKRFGDVIDHDETSGIMYAPARAWPQIEMVAFDADGEGAMRDEGIAEEQLDEKCWDGYEKKGMKTMFGKRVPNCVKNEGEERNEMDTAAVQAALAKMAERHKGEKWSKEQLAALGKRIAARGQKPVKEDDVADFLARGGKITQVKPNRGPRNPGLSLGSRHIGGGGDRMKASRTGRGSKPQGKPVVAVEADVDEGWKSKLAGAALAGAAALYDSIIANKRITPLIETHTETVPLVNRKWYFFIILLLAVAEWLLRKYWLAQ